MTKDDFIRRHRNHVAGVIAMGTTTFRREVLAGSAASPTDLGKVLSDLQATTEQLLGQLYDAMHKPAETNGKAVRT
jgi:hypothetical protein